MKIAQWNYLGPRSTPHEVRDLRKASFDYHRKMGMAIIHKHKWNLRDVREGRAQICPYHDVTLGEDSQFDPFCFGTGILGGFQDGVITYITLADTQEDRIRVSREGVLLMETHPQFTAPWVPDMGDQDLIITAEFDSENWEILQELDRYALQEVTHRTMRGFEKNKGGYRVHQEGNMDKLPYSHKLYDVPIVFDYNNLPPVPVVPVGGDPDDYPTDPNARISSTDIAVRITGHEMGLSSETERGVHIIGLGNNSITTHDVRITGDNQGTDINFNEGY